MHDSNLISLSIRSTMASCLTEAEEDLGVPQSRIRDLQHNNESPINPYKHSDRLLVHSPLYLANNRRLDPRSYETLRCLRLHLTRYHVFQIRDRDGSCRS